MCVCKMGCCSAHESTEYERRRIIYNSYNAKYNNTSDDTNIHTHSTGISDSAYNTSGVRVQTKIVAIGVAMGMAMG